jgi:hypothetical protein
MALGVEHELMKVDQYPYPSWKAQTAAVKCGCVATSSLVHIAAVF